MPCTHTLQSCLWSSLWIRAIGLKVFLKLIALMTFMIMETFFGKLQEYLTRVWVLKTETEGGHTLDKIKKKTYLDYSQSWVSEGSVP